ncbi:hypothetical protein TcBrA4_0126240 [Trypanosoma cruzi]|nr:hypothetical protein TcBrA4_0126240 [Trypanosoma cruzi]
MSQTSRARDTVLMHIGTHPGILIIDEYGKTTRYLSALVYLKKTHGRLSSVGLWPDAVLCMLYAGSVVSRYENSETV